jgi:hypothetical protein
MSHAHDLPDGLVIRNLATSTPLRHAARAHPVQQPPRHRRALRAGQPGPGLQALGLSLNAAFEKMIPTKHPYIVNFLENRGQLAGMGNSLRIAVEAKEGDIFDPTTWTR